MLERIENERACRAEQLLGLSGEHRSVRKLNCGGRSARLFRNLVCGRNNLSVGGGNVRLAQQKLKLFNLLCNVKPLSAVAEGFVIAADNFLLCGTAYSLVVKNAVACHVDAHVRRRLIWRIAVDVFKNRLKHRENFNVAVIVDGLDIVCVKVERVKHIHIVEVCGCGLIGKVDRVTERQIPDWKGFKLRVAGLNAAQVLVIELRKAGGHFSAAGAGGGNNNKSARGFNILVFAVACFGDNLLHV